MKDIFEAIETRVKSPVFGYFVLSMLAVNWKPFFFLFFDDSSVTSRFSYFDLHSSYTTLLVYPALLAALYSIIYPWIQYTFIWISSKPAHLKNLQTLTAEHKRLIEQQKLENVRNEQKKEAELEVIERAKRDQKVAEEITDEETREKVQSEIDEIRQNPHPSSSDALSTEQIEILKIIAENNGSIFKDSLIQSFSWGTITIEYYIEDLISRKYVVSDQRSAGGTRFSLTTKGKKYAIDCRFA
ncbi:hypothetical protein AB8E32_17380 [Marinomonas polaris]|uniref:hypothetical protein n=1 Tax=Marinomonas polaris TaxID=293552 RepID=UPI0035159F53